MAQSLGFGIRGLGFGVQDSGCMVKGLMSEGFSGFRIFSYLRRRPGAGSEPWRYRTARVRCLGWPEGL